jgi:hypothetical protein
VIKYVSVITTSHLKMGVEASPETSCISVIRQIVDSIQYIVPTARFELIMLELCRCFLQLLPLCIRIIFLELTPLSEFIIILKGNFCL